MEIGTVEEDVCVTCPTTIPKDQDVVISWETYNQEIMGVEISIGTAAGQWDLFTGQFGQALSEVKLPAFSHDLTPLYVEFRYIVPYVHSEDAKTQEWDEPIKDHDRYEIRLLHETPLTISRV